MMWARGIDPTVDLGWNWTPEGVLALGQTLKEAGVPLHVNGCWLPGGWEELYKKNTIWMEGVSVANGVTRKWPCYLNYDTTYAHDFLVNQMQAFQTAGLRIAAVWFDYEDIPAEWDGGYAVQKGSAECAAKYPPGVLDTFATYKPFMEALRTKILDAALVDPIHEVFPQAPVSNFGEMATGKFGVAVPCVYVDNRALQQNWKLDRPITPEEADAIYFPPVLHVVSAALATKVPGKLAVPYFSRFCPMSADPRWAMPMSSGIFRELIRHSFLRGADSVFLYNAGNGPYTINLPDRALWLGSIEDARSVYDELLSFREFPDHGTPMNREVRRLRAPAWSGPGWRCRIRCWCGPSPSARSRRRST